jgi:hypothetical protein
LGRITDGKGGKFHDSMVGEMDVMGFWKITRKLAWGATKLTAKTVTTTTGLAYRGTKATANVIYDHREVIGAVAARTAKVVYKTAAFTGKTVYDHREKIGGTFVGAAKGAASAIHDFSGHFLTNDSLNSQLQIVEMQSQRYRELTIRFNERLRVGGRQKDVLLDTLVVGGETLAAYINSEQLPEGIQSAYELAYPNVAATRSFSDQVDRLDGQELVGFVSGVKGKLFELQYVDYLNDGHLPDGFRAELASSPTNSDWDIAIIGKGGALRDTIQAKATESATYVTNALEKNPQIDVVTTSEVYSHLVMQGFSESVIDSGISEDVLTASVEGAMDGATTSMQWIPSSVSLALIAFTAYNQEGLSAYQKSSQFGERSSKSYLAYLAGGSLAVATNTWWIGVLGGMGSRIILGAGRKKRERLMQLKQLAQSNQAVLRQLEQQIP